ncbi:hypothetical protein GCM10027062_08160 [Nocardioides hungaricus]
MGATRVSSQPGEAVSAQTELPLPTEVDRLVRVPYAFEDYLALPERHRAEYGEVALSLDALLAT